MNYSISETEDLGSDSEWTITDNGKCIVLSCDNKGGLLDQYDEFIVLIEKLLLENFGQMELSIVGVGTSNTILLLLATLFFERGNWTDVFIVGYLRAHRYRLLMYCEEDQVKNIGMKRFIRCITGEDIIHQTARSLSINKDNQWIDSTAGDCRLYFVGKITESVDTQVFCFPAVPQQALSYYDEKLFFHRVGTPDEVIRVACGCARPEHSYPIKARIKNVSRRTTDNEGHEVILTVDNRKFTSDPEERAYDSDDSDSDSPETENSLYAEITDELCVELDSINTKENPFAVDVTSALGHTKVFYIDAIQQHSVTSVFLGRLLSLYQKIQHIKSHARDYSRVSSS